MVNFGSKKFYDIEPGWNSPRTSYNIIQIIVFNAVLNYKVYSNNFTLIIDIYFRETFSTSDLF